MCIVHSLKLSAASAEVRVSFKILSGILSIHIHFFNGNLDSLGSIHAASVPLTLFGSIVCEYKEGYASNIVLCFDAKLDNGNENLYDLPSTAYHL